MSKVYHTMHTEKVNLTKNQIKLKFTRLKAGLLGLELNTNKLPYPMNTQDLQWVPGP